jgi:predicted helicase
MKNMLAGENISLIASKINRQSSLGYFFVSKEITDFHILDTAGDSTFQFPLYLFKDSGTCTPNLKKEIVDKIEKVVGKLSPEDIFYYIYAVLYSPSYREKYKEFLKKDFPRVPYPKNAKSFKKLVAFGTELCSLHLLESQKVSKFLTTYPVGGSNIVENPIYKDGRVFINKDQYFGKVPDAVWNFWIGGYQPAQKWLKYRKGHELTNEDIEHYQKMIVSLTETDKIMQEIDELYPEVEKDLI